MLSMIEQRKSGAEAPCWLALSSDSWLRWDAKGQVRTPGPTREALLAQFDRSGLSGAEFARLVGIKYPTFPAGCLNGAGEQVPVPSSSGWRAFADGCPVSRQRRRLRGLGWTAGRWVDGTAQSRRRGCRCCMNLSGGQWREASRAEFLWAVCRYWWRWRRAKALRAANNCCGQRWINWCLVFLE
jgi:hypothetical protein